MEHFCDISFIVKYDTFAHKSKLQYHELALTFSCICNWKVLLSVTYLQKFATVANVVLMAFKLKYISGQIFVTYLMNIWNYSFRLTRIFLCCTSSMVH